MADADAPQETGNNETRPEPAFNNSKYDRFGFTAQQRDFLHHYLTDCDLDPVRAAQAAGYSENWAKACAPDFIASAKFKKYLEDNYSKDAVRERIWQFYFRLLQGLSATRIMKIGQGSGTQKPIKTLQVPDWPTRINALVQGFKVFGEYAPTKVNVEGDILAGKSDEEKEHLIGEANQILARLIGAAQKSTVEGEDSGD